MGVMYDLISDMYKHKQMGVPQVMSSVKGRHITLEQAKTILGSNYKEPVQTEENVEEEAEPKK